jgi:hypothetical protein
MSSYYISGELNSLKILNLVYIDTKESVQRVSNHVLINTKTYYTHLLMMKIFFFISLKFFYLKKKKFFFTILSNNGFLKKFSCFSGDSFKKIFTRLLKIVVKKKLLDNFLVININKINR